MSYQAPGVYIDYVTEGPLTIRAASTSTAVFVGKTKIGGSVDAQKEVTPLKISSVLEYTKAFATVGTSHGAVSMPTASSQDDDHMGLAVAAFFANGGAKAYVVSTKLDTGAEKAAAKGFVLKNGAASQKYTATAKSAGKWGSDIEVKLATSNSGAGFADVEVSLACHSDADTPAKKTERYIGVPIDGVDKLASSLVTLAAGAAGNPTELDTAAQPPVEKTVQLSGGTDSANGPATYADIFEELKDKDDLSLIVLPDLTWDSAVDKAAINQAINHAQSMKDRMVLVQVKDDVTDWDNVGLPQTQFLSAYHPKAEVKLKNGAGEIVTVTTGLTGHSAGVIARTDETKGAWTAAAGTHADARGIASLTKVISQIKQEDINKNNVNAVRLINGIPTVWGARTRDQGGIYEYQPVTRTAFLIADSLRSALERAVFAKNTEVLWANLKASVTGFMTTLYGQGAFQGASASEAFQVACGLDESMTQAEIDTGLLRVTVRFRAAKPAEFIEVSVEQLFADSL